MNRNALFSALLFATGTTWETWATEPYTTVSKTFRPYADGPLTSADYLAEIPEKPPTGILAMTKTELRWKFEYRTAREGTSCRSELKSIGVFAVVLQDKSWNSDTSSARLLDHGQGHFDITQVFALEWELRLRKELQQGETMSGKGTTEAEANSDLKRQLDARLKSDQYLLLDRHRDYDRDTDHGRKSTELAEQRLAHRQRLKQLSEQLAKLPTASATPSARTDPSAPTARRTP